MASNHVTPAPDSNPSEVPAHSLDSLLGASVEQKASDIYLTVGAPPTLRVEHGLVSIGEAPLADWDMLVLLENLLSDEQMAEFERALEYNTAIDWQGKARFRISVYRQQQHNAMVIRRIQTEIPSSDGLGLPEPYRKLIMMRRGLVLVVGPTGSGKSTSLAALIGHRNMHSKGHIITIEDPIEFVHTHKSCIVSQRDVGLDTHSYANALKNALRQHPDVILIGEVRDRETMDHAINFAETGHLCVATLHANNAAQALERVLNFFPEEKHAQVLLNLSLNLRGILAQRLVPSLKGTRALAVEILLNEGAVTHYIQENKIREIRDLMERNRNVGMQTFDQSLLDLYQHGEISDTVALAEADNVANLRLAITQKETAEKIQKSSGSNTIAALAATVKKADDSF